MRRHLPLVLGRALIREMIPSLLLATGVTTFLLIIRAIFGLADLFVAHSVSPWEALTILGLSLPHILVLTIPIGALFAVLITSARLSGDSELIALQACGVRLSRAARPLLVAGAALFLLDGWLTLGVMPKANRSLEETRMRLALSGAKAAVEPRVFIEDFPGRLLYVDRIDRTTGRWLKVLLFDQTAENEERLVVADSGELVTDPRDGTAWLNLHDTVTHLLQPDHPEKYRRNSNQELSINLTPPAVAPDQIRVGVRSTDTVTLLGRLRHPESHAAYLDALVELHKRVAIPAAALVFALVGFPLGVRNRRGGKSFGLTISVGLVVLYYVLLNNGELLARAGDVPIAVGIWLPNIILAAAGALLLRRASRSAVQAQGSGWWGQRVMTWMRRLFGGRSAAGGTARSTGTARSMARCGEDATTSYGPPLVGTVDRYLLRQCVSLFVLVIIAISAIYVIVNLSEDIEDIQKHAVPLTVVASHYFLMLPQIFHDILPISFLIAFLGTAAVLERHNETTALKAAGVSLTRVALPMLLLSLACGAGLFAIDESVVQRANRATQRTEDIIRGRPATRSYRAADRPWLFLPDGHTLVNFLQYDPDTKTLLRPSVYVFDDGLNLRARYSADHATYHDGRWEAQDAWSRTMPIVGDQEGSFARHAGTFDLPIPVDPSYFGQEYLKPSQMGFSQLREYIKTLSSAGYRVDKQRVELQQKIAYPLSIFVLSWLALPFAFRMGRRGTVVGIGIALVLGIAYFATTALVTKLGEASLLPPSLAAWTPTVVFALLAINRQTTLRT
jgi:LPS export ABC transporter permease LptG/LPS export ABC transporter permease LptF